MMNEYTDEKRIKNGFQYQVDSLWMLETQT